MEKLINITEKNGRQVVSARELHEFLEVDTQFRTWIDRMLDYGFEENIDYTRANIFVRGNEAKDYALTLDCAKEISMIQRSEKGKQARRYFIACEKQLKKGGLALPQTYAEALRELADATDREIKTQIELTHATNVIEENKPQQLFPCFI